MIVLIAVSGTAVGVVGLTLAGDEPGVRPMIAGIAPLADGRAMPSLAGATGWLNSPALRAADLRGKVVLINFWTYTCINWMRSFPYVRAWAERYKDQGLVVIGVHAPE
jgi:thiol-disulfide isomerase/thioredoxin